VEPQLRAYLGTRKVPVHTAATCSAVKDIITTQVRTVLGTILVKSPRLHQRSCQPHPAKTVSPLAALLLEHIMPELVFLETMWAALVSYGITAPRVREVLPIDEALAPCTIRENVFTVAERPEQALGDEQWSFIDRCPAEWSRLPLPNCLLTGGSMGLCPGAAERRVVRGDRRHESVGLQAGRRVAKARLQFVVCVRSDL
jgi:hypothetical protein